MVRSLIKRAAAAAADHEKVWLEAAPPQPEEDALALFFEKMDLLGYGGTPDNDEPLVGPEESSALKTSIQAVTQAIAALQAKLETGARKDHEP